MTFGFGQASKVNLNNKMANGNRQIKPALPGRKVNTRVMERMLFYLPQRACQSDMEVFVSRVRPVPSGRMM
jgi:hypothetical protein